MATPFVPQPGAPLLQFPGEVRNKIIRNIFKQDGRILLLPYVGPATHPSSPVMTCAVPDIQVFLTCHQFYGETRSIFLEDNTFMLSTQFDAYADASSLRLFSRWMRSLGLYRDYVRKVIIDLSPLCPGPCHLARPWIDLKPIMVEIWRYQAILATNHTRQRANINVFRILGTPALGTCTPPRSPYASAIRYQRNQPERNDHAADSSAKPGNEPLPSIATSASRDSNQS